MEKFGVLDIWQVFSLDVVAGSLATGFMAVKLTPASPGWAWWLCMPAAVWSIYTIDHLIDGHKAGAHSPSKRHRFHYQFAKQIIILLVAIVIAAGIIAVTGLNREILFFGIVMGMVAAAYLAAVWKINGKRKGWMQKELYISLIYTTGVWGGPVLLSDFHILPWVWMVMGAFVIMVFSEGSIAALYEYQTDKKERSTSLPVLIGYSRTKRIVGIIVALLIAGTLMFSLEYGPPQNIAAGIILLMSIGLGSILFFRQFFSKNYRYHNFGEAVFIIPAGMMLI